MSTLFTLHVAAVLQPYFYQATELGYSYTLGTLTNGISLSFVGFSDPTVMKLVVGLVAKGNAKCLK